jgi:uncharacterized ion transporter superfamily protein YfcC
VALIPQIGVANVCPSVVIRRMTKYFLAAAIALALLTQAAAQSSARSFYKAARSLAAR